MPATNKTNTCLNKLYKSQERRAAVEDILLGGSYWGYTWYRLRLFGASKGIGIILHFLELFLFFNQLHQDVFLKLALIRIIIGLFEASWWGLLEGLRGGVRHDLENYRLTKCQLRISSWFSWSSLAGGAILLAACLFLFFGLLLGSDGEQTFSILYIFAYLFRLATSIVSRTVHGAVYGYSRVYRPLWSIIAADVLWLVTLIALWPLIGLYAIIPGTIFSALATTVLSIYFALPLYKRLHFDPPSFNRLALFNKLGPRWPDALSALASLAMRVGSMVLLGFFHTNNNGFFSLFWSVFFIVNIPILDLAASWCNLFYFDFKKYAQPAFSAVYPRLNRFINWISYELGLVSWIISYLIGSVFLGDDMFDLLLGSALFFILRSRLGAVQIRAFCEKHYWPLILSALVLALGMTVLNMFTLPNLTRNLYFGGLLLLAIVLLETFIHYLNTHKCPINGTLPYELWLKNLTRARQIATAPLTVWKLQFSQNYYELSTFMQQLADKLPPTATLTLWPGNITLYFDSARPDLPYGREYLYRLGHGQLRNIRSYNIQPAAATHLDKSYPWQKKCPSAITNREQLISYLHCYYPQTILLDLHHIDQKELAALDNYERHILLKAAYRYTISGRPISAGFHKILALTNNGTIIYILLVPNGNKNLTLLTKHLLHFSILENN